MLLREYNEETDTHKHFISYNILYTYKYSFYKIVCATVEIQYNYILLKTFYLKN